MHDSIPFVFHLPRVLLNAADVAHNGLVSSLPPSSGSQSILERSRAPPLPRPIGFAMKPAYASIIKIHIFSSAIATTSVHGVPSASFDLLRPLSTPTQAPPYTFAHISYTMRFSRLISVETMLLLSLPILQFESFHFHDQVRSMRGRLISLLMTHTIDSSFLHYFHSIFLPPLLPIPSSSVHLLNSLFRRHLFSYFFRLHSTYFDSFACSTIVCSLCFL
jgi:hypothetical protein